MSSKGEGEDVLHGLHNIDSIQNFCTNFASESEEKGKTSKKTKIDNHTFNKSSNTSYNEGKWSTWERQRFFQGMIMFPKSWKEIQKLVKTRTLNQLRSFCQKIFHKIKVKTNLKDAFGNYYIEEKAFKDEFVSLCIETGISEEYINIFEKDQEEILNRLKALNRKNFTVETSCQKYEKENNRSYTNTDRYDNESFSYDVFDFKVKTNLSDGANVDKRLDKQIVRENDFKIRYSTCKNGVNQLDFCRKKNSEETISMEEPNKNSYNSLSPQLGGSCSSENENHERETPKVETYNLDCERRENGLMKISCLNQGIRDPRQIVDIRDIYCLNNINTNQQHTIKPLFRQESISQSYEFEEKEEEVEVEQQDDTNKESKDYSDLSSSLSINEKEDCCIKLLSSRFSAEKSQSTALKTNDTHTTTGNMIVNSAVGFSTSEPFFLNKNFKTPDSLETKKDFKLKDLKKKSSLYSDTEGKNYYTYHVKNLFDDITNYYRSIYGKKKVRLPKHKNSETTDLLKGKKKDIKLKHHKLSEVNPSKESYKISNIIDSRILNFLNDKKTSVLDSQPANISLDHPESANFHFHERRLESAEKPCECKCLCRSSFQQENLINPTLEINNEQIKHDIESYPFVNNKEVINLQIDGDDDHIFQLKSNHENSIFQEEGLFAMDIGVNLGIGSNDNLSLLKYINGGD